MPSYLVGVDIGGTFTDCVIIDNEGQVTTAKVPSTPADFARGMVNAVHAGADALGVNLEVLCRNTKLLTHGTTVGTNAVIQKKGAKVGLITTKGHNDVIHIMRGSRGLSGRELDKVVHFPESTKPDPIIPKSLIEGVSERVDCFGSVVVPQRGFPHGRMMNKIQLMLSSSCQLSKGSCDGRDDCKMPMVLHH